MKKLPSLIFVKWEYPGGNDAPFLTAFSSPQDVSEQNETVEAGLYKFVGQKRIINSTTVKDK